jgi:HD-GYP domain-containing protein (c-di-GMP phosphodiesterase class II)
LLRAQREVVSVENGPVVTIRKTSEEVRPDDRWHGRPLLSVLVRVVVFLIPISLSIASATITAHVLPRPHSTGWLVGWWSAVLAVPTVVLVASDRIARRALPLAILLKMTMVFPDRAPKRLAVARRAASTRDLAHRVEEARTRGTVDEPVLAAEKILALAAALNAHDRLTRGHGERVGAFTELIAAELHLPTADRDRLRWSALLHDVGKLTVHSDILNKHGKLNDEEWAVIRNHPLEGARLTAPLAGWLGVWADTIVQHHEKYDGTGYPYGLVGDQISLGARIVAVADSYDVMTATRSYRHPISPQAARAELAACAGSQFDPHVVRAFLDVSIGRLRPMAAPLAWIGSLPFVDSIPQIGQVASTLGRTAAASVVAAGAVTAGSLQTAAQTTALPHLSHAMVATGMHRSGAAPFLAVHQTGRRLREPDAHESPRESRRAKV